MKRSHIPLALIITILLSPAHAETWKNKAGHTIEGTLVLLKNDMVTLKTETGSERKIPLSAFDKSHQEIIKKYFSPDYAPDGLKSHREFARRQINRAALLCEQGIISAHEYQEIKANINKALRTVKSRTTEASD